MLTPEMPASVDEQIALWRSYLRHRQTIQSVDVAELEDHLREQIAALVAAGLALDEAFLVAVKRMGNLDALSREFAREHSERLWKQLVLDRADGAAQVPARRRDTSVAFVLAAVAAVAVKVPLLFGMTLDRHETFYARNASLFVFPLLAGYFAWKRNLTGRTLAWLAAGFAAAAVFANVYPFPAAPQSNTGVLAMVHLPIACWLLVGIAYAGSRWGEVAGRMDFIRFSGELFIYYVLIALGGGVFVAFMAMIFEAIGMKIDPVMAWVGPCGAAAGVLVAAWLVEAKQSVIENMAPVLTRLFTPLFAVLLVAFLATVLFTGRAVDVNRDVLIAFDLVLALVLCLLLYAVSARDPLAPPGVFDLVQVVLIVAALLADATALWTIAGRISGMGLTPNRVAALGENAVLLVNLGWSVVVYIRFLKGRSTFAALERWQTGYLPVLAAWAAIVVVVFPPLFGYR